LHKLRIEATQVPEPAKPPKPRFVTVDLNDFNHCQQLFPSVEQYEATRVAYLKDLVERFAFVEDAITGNRLSIDDQVRLPRCLHAHRRVHSAR
jgi:hypothetical protein